MNNIARFLLIPAFTFASAGAVGQTRDSNKIKKAPATTLPSFQGSQAYTLMLDTYIDDFNRVFRLAHEARGDVAKVLSDPSLAHLPKEDLQWLKTQLNSKAWPKKLELKKTTDQLELYSPSSSRPIFIIGLKKFGEKPILSVHGRDIDASKFINSKHSLEQLHSEIKTEMTSMASFRAWMSSLNFVEKVAVVVLSPIALLTACTGDVAGSDWALASGSLSGRLTPTGGAASYFNNNISNGSVRGGNIATPVNRSYPTHNGASH